MKGGNPLNTNDFNENKIYAIGESHNIAMMTAASSVASLLNSNVWITNPSAGVYRIMDFIYADLAPSVFVRVNYSGGANGTAILIFKQSDTQLILNQLMGMPLVVTPYFSFDEINTSALGEIINQMMSSYFAEITQLTGTVVMTSTPEVIPNNAEQNIYALMGLNPDDSICAINSELRVDSSINGKFITILPVEMAYDIAEKTESRFPMPAMPEPTPDLSAPPGPFSAGNNDQSLFSMPPNNDDYSLDSASPFSSLAEQPASFSSFQNTLTQDQLNNLQLLMNVPLELAIEIGSTQRKVDDILSFSHGTIIELDSPADAPVNVIVNGHLIAKGDVVVVDDYFAVRVTEIIKSNLIDTLRNKE